MNKRFYDQDFTLGILGGGQLGRMFIQEAINLNLSVDILDPDPNAPCKEIATHFSVGDLNDFDTVLHFGKNKDVVTIEIEHVNVDALEQLEKQGVLVYPQSAVLRIIQDKGLQKDFYKTHNIPTAPFHLISSKAEINAFMDRGPFMQKLRKGGYDGRGVTPIRSEKDLENAFDAPSLLEEFVNFKTEISVIVGRNPNGDIKAFPTVELNFNPDANLVEYLFSPGALNEEVERKAQDLAKSVAEALGIVGILAIEMFVTRDDEVLVNEVAPRPHNSGHQSIEANVTSQYAQHLRSIMNLPLGDTSVLKPSVMVNLLGEKEHTGPAVYQNLEEVLSWPGVYVHLYGKNMTKPYRKMGHVTVVNSSLSKAKEIAIQVKKTLKVVSA